VGQAEPRHRTCRSRPYSSRPPEAGAQFESCRGAIQSSRWFIEPASDTPREQTIAAFVEDNLFNNRNVSWSQILSAVLLKLV